MVGFLKERVMSDEVWNEAAIIINGHRLTTAQSMVVRVAMGSFALSLQANDALGDDAHGVAMRAGYQGRIREIMAMWERP